MNRQAWQEHARQRQAVEPALPAAAPSRMYWTPEPDGGPGAEILGHLACAGVLELGCGAGHHLAHLVGVHGATGVGVDISERQIERARTRYGDLPGIAFVADDAAQFLEASCHSYDVCYSVFGAVGLTSPNVLVPLIARALRPGGVLAFAVPHPRRSDRGSTSLLPSGDRVPIRRWELSVLGWVALLSAADFRVDDLQHLGEPPAGPKTLLIVARKS
ncbi:class I SAM-dependent methyltransferase [Microbispora cellulosiformans]|uniref:Class I SAM-dependent methyltransferase n=1 Tax=Microbispora cellulosiformans TaxID=2614688 RepID=A0A5J5K658_9ACTN|nr:class I SAM-dependent methyltransferase [Microbispora cellulosiformans]KAA9380091.1 class I SAM-dependent methyltransferase [Microbispora cellulosiformans]